MKYAKKILLLLLGLAVSGFTIYKLNQYFDYDTLIKTVSTIGTTTIVSCVVLYLSTFIFRAYRWKIMVGKFSDTSIFTLTRSVVIGFAANNLLPLRLGEIVRAWTISKDTGVPATISLSSVLVEKVIDAITIVSLMLLGNYYINSINQNQSQILNFVAIGFFLVLLVMFVVLFFENKLTLLWLTISKNIPDKIQKLPLEILESFKFFKTKKSVNVILLSIFIWLIEAAVFILIIRASGVEQAIPYGLFTLGTVNLSILVPAAPGYIGVFQAGTLAGLLGSSANQTSALAIAIVIHAIQFVPITIAGLLLFIQRGFKYER